MPFGTKPPWRGFCSSDGWIENPDPVRFSPISNWVASRAALESVRDWRSQRQRHSPLISTMPARLWKSQAGQPSAQPTHHRPTGATASAVPDRASIERLVGAVTLEIAGEWRICGRSFSFDWKAKSLGLEPAVVAGVDPSPSVHFLRTEGGARRPIVEAETRMRQRLRRQHGSQRSHKQGIFLSLLLDIGPRQIHIAIRNGDEPLL